MCVCVSEGDNFLRQFGYDVIYFENNLIIIVSNTKGEGIM